MQSQDNDLLSDKAEPWPLPGSDAADSDNGPTPEPRLIDSIKYKLYAARSVIITSFRDAPIPFLVTLGAGAGGAILLGTGVGLAATGEDAALQTVASSNLSMVLALAGTAMLFVASISSYRLYNQKPAPITYFFAAAILGLIVAGISYAGVHIGIASALPVGLSTVESLAAQSGLSFLIGGALTAILCGIGYAVMERQIGPSEHMPTLPRTVALVAAMGGVCAASTALGPWLSECMGKAMGQAAANTAEATSMEAILALAISSLTLMICASIYQALAPARNTYYPVMPE